MNKEARKKVFEYLEKHGIEYKVYEHPEAPTCEIAMQFWKDIPGEVTHCKNLFMRNHKGDRHYLVIMPWDKPLDIHALWAQIGSTRLSFASSERMMRYLGVTPGSVSLFGLVNDVNAEVELIMDESLVRAQAVSFHPNDNTASVVIDSHALRAYLATLRQKWSFADLPEGENR